MTLITIHYRPKYSVLVYISALRRDTRKEKPYYRRGIIAQATHISLAAATEKNKLLIIVIIHPLSYKNREVVGP